MPKFAWAIAAIICLFAAGCQTAAIEKTGPITIQSVNVTTASTFKAATDIETPMRRALNRTLVGRDPGGKPVNVAVTLQRATYKDPVMSILIGSSNSIASTVVIRGEGGTELAEFDVVDSLDNFPQGVIGAIGAALQKDEMLDREFVQVHPRSVERRIFGDKPRPVEAVLPAPAGETQVAPAGQTQVAPVS